MHNIAFSWTKHRHWKFLCLEMLPLHSTKNRTWFVGSSDLFNSPKVSWKLILYTFLHLRVSPGIIHIYIVLNLKIGSYIQVIKTVLTGVVKQQKYSVHRLCYWWTETYRKASWDEVYQILISGCLPHNLLGLCFHPFLLGGGASTFIRSEEETGKQGERKRLSQSHSKATTFSFLAHTHPWSTSCYRYQWNHHTEDSHKQYFGQTDSHRREALRQNAAWKERRDPFGIF